MKYTLVRPTGEAVYSMDFDIPPDIPQVKGKWVADVPPNYDPIIQNITRDQIQSVSAASISYTVAYKPLQEIKDIKKAIIESEYHAAIATDVLYMGHMFQADEASQALLTATVVTLNGAGATPLGFGWWSTDNVKVDMNLAQLNGLAQTMFTQGMIAFPTKRAKKDLVDAALTVEDVLSI